MAALDALTEKDLVRNLLWPVCIAGCSHLMANRTFSRLGAAGLAI
jgi:hypothetical protein